MARRPSSAAQPDPNAPTPAAAEPAAAPPSGPKQTIEAALLALLTEKPWGEIGLFEIAERAGVSLAELRAAFPSKGAILAGFVRRIDIEVLRHDARDMADEPARERLFDVLMRRLEALAPHRPALRAVRRGLSVDPLGAAAMNQVAVSSMQWMLAAAGVQESGPVGTARAQALVLVNARVFDVFLNDEDESLARTMKALDEELRKAERWARRADDAFRLTAPFRAVFDRAIGRRRRSRDEDEPLARDDAAAA
ncbi:TetR/AcrR family transcriptional regulator [Methylopila musalis]|uniref:TetR/AcrR family transcriptional regulator n=1 Tax=Methylopila musalis TaxID=1134781 RepID=A0ABW3Z9M5_9HYPH